MKKLFITAAVAMVLPLCGCAEDSSYPGSYNERYYGSGYYSTHYYDEPHFYHQYRNGYNWPY